jgi:hypothetical protein
VRYLSAMKWLFVLLCVLCLAGAALGGVTYGPRAGTAEKTFQATVERLAEGRVPGTKPTPEEERELKELAGEVARAKASFAGSLGGGLMLAALFALLAKQHGRKQAPPPRDESPA